MTERERQEELSVCLLDYGEKLVLLPKMTVDVDNVIMVGVCLRRVTIISLARCFVAVDEIRCGQICQMMVGTAEVQKP